MTTTKRHAAIGRDADLKKLLERLDAARRGADADDGMTRHHINLTPCELILLLPPVPSNDCLAPLLQTQATDGTDQGD